MTPIEIIEIVDRITPNAHTDADKLRWLGALDAQIVRETAMLFDDDPVNLSLLFQDYVPDAEQRLCVSGPDAEELYGSYLQACMAWADEDDARYDRFITIHWEAPRFPGPLLVRTRCPDASPNPPCE